MNTKKIKSKLQTALLIPAVFIGKYTYAEENSGDWAKSAVDVLEKSEAGFMQIATTIFGVLIILAGVMAGVTGRLDGAKLWGLVFAGIIVAIGPTTVDMLFGWGS